MNLKKEFFDEPLQMKRGNRKMNKSFSIKIDQNVLNYMKKKRKEILTLDIITTGGGCCPTFEIAEVDLLKPKQPELFDDYEQDNITLYISKKAKIPAKTLQFKLEKKLFGATILVEGLSLKKH